MVCEFYKKKIINIIMRRLLTLLFVFLGFFLFKIQAQHDSHFSLFEYAQMSYNPGYTGANDALCVTSTHRQGWVGFGDGRPQTTVFSFDMPLNAISSGVGFVIVDDRLGFQSNLNIHVSYAYRIPLDFGQLGIGVGLGVINRTIDGDWITPAFLNGATIFEDPKIPHMGSSIDFDMSFGTHFSYDDFYVGLSATRLLEPTVSFDSEEPSKISRHYYLVSGYSYTLPNPIYDIIPSLQLQYATSLQIQLNAKFLYNKSFWGGVSYRYNDAIVPMVGVHLVNGISFGYGYDVVISEIGSYTSGTHEIMLRYCFDIGFGRTPGRYRTVRRL